MKNTEQPGQHWVPEDDDVQGHKRPGADKAAGFIAMDPAAATDDDDVEGHRLTTDKLPGYKTDKLPGYRDKLPGATDEDDVEGHRLTT